MAKTTDSDAALDAPPEAGSGRAETLRRKQGSSAPSSGALVGYARVSTELQVLDRQTDALTDAGCSKIFTDKVSSVVKRPELDAALAYLRPGDTLVIDALDRLGRKTIELLAFVDDLHARKVNLRILTLGVDTRTPVGQLVLTVMAAVAQLERDLLRERTAGGLAAARARGRVGGRPRRMTDQQVDHARELLDQGKPVREISRLLGIPEATVRRRLAARISGS
ncbi:recombinase family protein [Nocardioides pinisoli]|uniref:Recombinase family protein n=1 Tax=Nocardioides pinisoli TaxID=2950279 RepID=A0ABT1KRF5_9ACTN|nr:recombinase family protein [Nocardioides pinisoli]MCP3420322.1 recombinase family protein [Nocardioides pinisoli]